MTLCEKQIRKLPQLLVSSSLSMRVRVLFLTSGIRTILFCSLNISCSSPFHASLGPQPTAGTPAALLIPPLLHRRATAHLRQPLPHVAAPTSAPCPKDSLSARSPRAYSTGRRPRLPWQRNVSDGDRDCSDGGKGGKAGDGGAGSSKGRSRSSGGCSACGGSRARGPARK
jgi:hypothetical protein